MEPDLFAIFPDLPWAGVGHPPARQWQQIPKPPRSAPVAAGPLSPQHHLREDMRRTSALRDALARVYVIALSEQRRIRSKRKPNQALAQILEIANVALLTDDT